MDSTVLSSTSRLSLWWIGHIRRYPTSPPPHTLLWLLATVFACQQLPHPRAQSFFDVAFFFWHERRKAWILRGVPHDSQPKQLQKKKQQKKNTSSYLTMRYLNYTALGEKAYPAYLYMCLMFYKRKRRSVCVSLWEDVVAPWPTTSSSLARKQMKSQVVVTAAIPCLALGGLNTRAGILRGCYHKEQWLRAELRPVLRGKCCGPRQKLDGSASCCSSFIQWWRLRTRC